MACRMKGNVVGLASSACFKCSYRQLSPPGAEREGREARVSYLKKKLVGVASSINHLPKSVSLLLLTNKQTNKKSRCRVLPKSVSLALVGVASSINHLYYRFFY